MTTTSMYSTSVPVCTRTLTNLTHILEKAAAHAEAKKIDPAVLLNSRLYPDMLPLVRQIHIATDIARGGCARLAGVEMPSYADDETTIPQLLERVRKTIAFLETLTPAQIDGSEDKTVSWQTRSSSRSMQGQAYLLTHVLPNVFFHVTTAYGILRHNGLEIGKQDFLGKT